MTFLQSSSLSTSKFLLYIKCTRCLPRPINWVAPENFPVLTLHPLATAVTSTDYSTPPSTMTPDATKTRLDIRRRLHCDFVMGQCWPTGRMTLPTPQHILSVDVECAVISNSLYQVWCMAYCRGRAVHRSRPCNLPPNRTANEPECIVRCDMWTHLLHCIVLLLEHPHTPAYTPSNTRCIIQD